MSLYTRARKHIDMNRVKELREEKIERKKIADEIKAQITEDLRNINSPEFSNWRYDIDEGMTTSDIFSTTFPAQGDVDLGAAIETFSLSGPDDGNPDSFNKLEPNTLGNYKQYDTIIVNITSSTSEWRITPLTTLDDLGSGGVGNFRIVIPRSYPGLFFAAFGSGSITVTSTYQRRAPVNAFVSLDSPEATSFIRTDPTMKGLSAEDRKKKLIDMLDAGNEYLLKQLGIVGSSARPSDTTMPVSWDQAAGGGTDDMSDDLSSSLKLKDAQIGKIVTNVAGGTAFNPSLRAIGSQGKGLGGEVKIGQHGTGADAATKITAPVSDLKTRKRGIAGFKPGSRQNVYGRGGVFIDPTKGQKAADKFARAGAAAEAGGRVTAGRGFVGRAKDMFSSPPPGAKGVKIPVAYKPGTGSRSKLPIPGYDEVGMSADKATKGARLAQNAATKYPNSAKAAQLVKTGATTAKVGAARSLAKTLGKAVPFVGAAISVADAAVRSSRGDHIGAVMSGLTALSGPIGWVALSAQIATDAAGITGGTYMKDPTYEISTSGRGAGRRSFAKEEKEYGSYQDYVDRAKETIDKKNIKLDKDLLDVLKTELGLSDKLSDEDKEYLVDLFDDPKNIDPDEAMKFIKKIQKKLMSEKSIKEQVLTEKKRLKSPKDITSKIPGYYDGKPAPLGFPMQEPPKMVNGKHPDLVDGKKIANRFNRLDPQSAKAMPPTGNPHIDKKVRVAAKKPK